MMLEILYWVMILLENNFKSNKVWIIKNISEVKVGLLKRYEIVICLVKVFEFEGVYCKFGSLVLIKLIVI